MRHLCASTGGSATPTIQATVNATVTFTSLPSSMAPDPNLASLVASDISAYVGGSQPLVGIVLDTSGPDLAINISAVYPTNSQISGATTVNPASLQVPASGITCADTHGVMMHTSQSSADGDCV